MPPKIPKKKSPIVSFAKAFAPGKIAKAKKILEAVGKITTQDLIFLTPKAKGVVGRLRQETNIKKIMIMEVEGKINLNEPISKILKRKLTK